MSLDPRQIPRHTGTMNTLAMIQMTRIDPDRNMARFYELRLQPTLFGEASLLRAWGRIGTRGQSMMVTYANAEAAARALTRLSRQKQRRGYR
jgi:predicted DNA-binding WGR domain protein